VNTYYYYFHLDFPFWMTENTFMSERRGELYLYKHEQILARYGLERVANGMGSIPMFTWTDDIRTGYYPALKYYNGNFFPNRDNFYNLYNEYNYYKIDTVKTYERHIRDAIAKGFIEMYDGTIIYLTKPESIEMLGRYIHGTMDFSEKRFYGYLENFAKILLGTSMTTMNQYKTLPSALEHFETAMRDPLFYQLYKRIIINYYWSFKNYLPSYTHNELLFSGVTIQTVEMDKLVTYFDEFYSDITNVIDIETVDDAYLKSDLYTFGRKTHYKGKNVVIKAAQYRLNHKPFHVRMNVMSDKPQKAVVKTFLGPKYNEFGVEYTINENRENFFELDYFVVDLVGGMNVIERSCKEFNRFIQDHTTSFDLYKDVMMSTKSDMPFVYDKYEKHSGFPWRLMLPKGTKGGMVFKFFFMVMPYIEATTKYTSTDEFTVSTTNYDEYADQRSLGFPMDRKIIEFYWYTPNMYYLDATIYHE